MVLQSAICDVRDGEQGGSLAGKEGVRIGWWNLVSGASGMERRDAHSASMLDVSARELQARCHFFEHETADAAHVSPASGAVTDLPFADRAEGMAIGALRQVRKKRKDSE